MNKMMPLLILVIFFTGPSLEAQDAELLKRELAAVPGISDGVRLRILNQYANTNRVDIKEAYSIILKGHNLHSLLQKGGKDIVAPKYGVSDYNTALRIVAEIFDKNDVKDDDLLPLSMGVANSLLIAFGDDSVVRETLKKCGDYYRFLAETSDMQKEKGLPLLRDYPLEAQVFLSILWNSDLRGPDYPKDMALKSDVFGNVMDRKISLRRFNWCTITIDNLYRLRNHFTKTGQFSPNFRNNVRAVLSFINDDKKWKYPIRSNMDKASVDLMYKLGMGTPLEYMTFEGIECKNANWNNPNYAIEKLLAGENFYGWCTDVRQSTPFIAASMGIAAVQTGGGIYHLGSEYSHYFVLYYIPRHEVWIRDTRDYISNPLDSPTPILLKKAPLNLGTYWKGGNEVFYVQNCRPSDLKLFYDSGVPADLVRDITFYQKQINTKKIDELSTDTDRDGVSDFMEKIKFSTSPASMDSDGDGYSDRWEIESGFNAASKSSPEKKLTHLVLDGVKDDADITMKATVRDTKGDDTGGNDIKAVTFYSGGGKLYVQAEYHNRKKPDCFHTIRIRKSDGTNFWIQGKTALNDPKLKENYEWYSFFRFTDGEDFSIWKKLTPGPGAAIFADNTIFEAMVDLEKFDAGEVFQVNYAVSGFPDKWNSDLTFQAVLYKRIPAVRIDGDGADMLGALGMKSVTDASGDPLADSNIFDLKELYAGKDKDNLYLCAKFHNDIVNNGENVITWHLQAPGMKTNYWLQFEGTSFIFACHFKDGVPFESWDRLKLNDPRLKGIYAARDEDIEGVIPLSLFEDEEIKGGLRVRIILGGKKAGKSVWNTEESDFIDLP